MSLPTIFCHLLPQMPHVGQGQDSGLMGKWEMGYHRDDIGELRSANQIRKVCVYVCFVKSLMASCLRRRWIAAWKAWPGPSEGLFPGLCVPWRERESAAAEESKYLAAAKETCISPPWLKNNNSLLLLLTVSASQNSSNYHTSLHSCQGLMVPALSL